MTLVLVDIDGTLLDCGGRLRPFLEVALRDVYGSCGDVGAYDIGGKLDPQIVLDLAMEAGVERAAALAGLAAVRARFLEIVAARLPAGSVRLLPFAAPFLERLSRRAGVCLGLVTGNWEPSARHKLAAHDLNRFLPFGAFGDDGFARTELPPVAIARAEAQSGRRFTAEETWVVGDSRQDVDCARAHGLRSLAVATGWTSAADLEKAGAEFVVADLAAALEVIGGSFASLRMTRSE